MRRYLIDPNVLITDEFGSESYRSSVNGQIMDPWAMVLFNQWAAQQEDVELVYVGEHSS